MIGGVVCRTCMYKAGTHCEKGNLTSPSNIDECWMYRHKADKLNLSTRDKESNVVRLGGVWKY